MSTVQIRKKEIFKAVKLLTLQNFIAAKLNGFTVFITISCLKENVSRLTNT